MFISTILWGAFLRKFYPLFSQCKNAVTSANRWVTSSWPAEAINTAISQDIVFLSLRLHIFILTPTLSFEPTRVAII